jgi:hypothetical protein
MLMVARFVAAVFLVVIASGCGGNVLLHVRSVEGEEPSAVLPRGAEEPIAPPVGMVKFFFYPYVSDSVIHPVPEREFITDAAGRADFIERVSPSGDKMGALVAMKTGYYVDTLVFRYVTDDTLNIVVRLRRR